MKPNKLITAALFITLGAPSAWAADATIKGMSVEQRLQRMENLLSPEKLMEQTRSLELLREEISSLRSMIEEQEFALQTIKQRQRSLYLDMDRRLMNLESGAVNVSRSPVSLPNSGASATAAAGGTATAASSGSAGAKQAYTAAFELLKEGRYPQSIEAFTGFLATYPDSQYSDNAQYWLAEANYVSREYDTALGEFQKLIAQHPDSSKIPGARLKIGYVYYELKNWTEARNTLQSVVTTYPDTTVAKKAGERLARMKREGH